MKKTIKVVRGSMAFQEMNTSELYTFSDGTVKGLTGNLFITVIPVALTTISTQTSDVRATMSLIASGKTSKENTALLGQQAADLMLSLSSNGHSVQDQANIIAAGDVEKAKQIIATTGYKDTKPITHQPRSGFESVPSGPGTVHVRAKKQVKSREGRLYRYGITPTKEVPPTVLTTRFRMEADLVISDLTSLSIVGSQHASIAPASRTKKSTMSEAERIGSETVGKVRHPIVSHLTVDPYVGSDFIFIVVL